MRRASVVLTCAAAAGVAALSALGDARACAIAAQPGFEVAITAESALIVWDAARKTEHFIRRAKFDTSGAPNADFGFLVPTPTRPELAEAWDPFWSLEAHIQPPVVYEHRKRLQGGLLCLAAGERERHDDEGGATGATVTESAPVEVLDEVQVAGYEAAILAATDAGALAEWLKTHGYDERPALKDWLERYVAQGWILTAFKVTGTATAPVRLSFSTERPFYPYREPADDRPGGAPRGAPRSLRVFFVGLERVTGTIGDSIAWPGGLGYAAPVDREVVTNMVPALPEGGDLWLHAFMDGSSPRPGTDEVFFARDATQERRLPPPIVKIVHDDVLVPFEPIVLVGVGAIVLVRWRRRRAAKADPKKGQVS